MIVDPPQQGDGEDDMLEYLRYHLIFVCTVQETETTLVFSLIQQL